MIFSIPIYSDSFIHYLFALLQSIEDVYGDEGTICVYYADLSPRYIDEIKSKMPRVRLRQSFGPPVGSNTAARIAHGLYLWQQQLDDASRDAKIVLLDADMLFIRRFNWVWDWEFDLAYTVKEEGDDNPQWPVNCGMMLVRNCSSARRFIDEWIRIMKSDVELPEWGGIQQSAFGYILTCLDGTAANCTIRKMRCQQMNDIRRFPTITEDTHILHYKGKWRDVLPDGTWTSWIPEERGWHVYSIWRAAYERWQTRA